MASTTDDPEFVQRLHKIKQSLEHARRFQLHPNDWRSAVVQAEGDIEELLIDYGFQLSEERDSDPAIAVAVDHCVAAGASHNGDYRNRSYAEAKEIYDREAAAPSYIGSGKQSCTLYRVIRITERLEKNR